MVKVNPLCFSTILSIWNNNSSKKERLEKEMIESKLKQKIYFSVFVLLLLVEIYIAVFVRDNFIRPYIGDVLVTVVIYFFIRGIRSEGIKWLFIYVFLFSVCVEIAQYFNIIRLLGVENNRVASIILGGTFDWIDILCYGIGCVIAWSFSNVLDKKGVAE